VTGQAQDVAARLQQLAARVPTVDDAAPDTAARAAAVNRSRRQRGARWTAAAAAVVVLGSTAVLTRPDEAPVAVAAPAPTPQGAPPPAVYQQPPRGSLADDEEFLAAVAALPWSAMDPGTGVTWEIEPDTRRVVYAADVPGGHRWALVMARWRQQWAVAWFSGPRGATPAQLTEAYQATPWTGTAPLALIDASEPRGPLLLLAEPGVGAEYSPSLDRAPDGRMVRDFDPLPVVDGAPLGMVTTPVTWNAGEVHQLIGTTRTPVFELRITGNPEWQTRWGFSDTTPDEAVLAACLTGLGLDVDDGPGEGDLSWGWTDTGQTTSAEDAEREEAAADCHAQASSP
jgi:hypothetical protein